MSHGMYMFAGSCVGFIVGLTGIGGGALMTPLLLLFFGVTPVTAVATDLWFAAITKIVAICIHRKAKLAPSGLISGIDWQVVRRLWLGSLPTAIIVVIVSLHTRIGKVEWLSQAIAIVVVITALGLLFAPALVAAAQNRRPSSLKTFQSGFTIIAGSVLGFFVAFTSVGAGALGTVMLLYLYPAGMTPHRLVATEMMHAIPLAIVAGIGYLFAGSVNGQMLTYLLIGSTPAVIAGSLLSAKISGRWMQITLAILLLVTGIQVLRLT